MKFKNRVEAGKQLAFELEMYKDNENAVILAIPKGGIPIGSALADHLRLPLQIMLVKKIPAPDSQIYTLGTVSIKEQAIDEAALSLGNVSKAYLEGQIKSIRNELKEQYDSYYGAKKPESIKGKIVIICDDGIATGRTMLAVVQMVKKEDPKKIVVAVPVGSERAASMLGVYADEVIFLQTPSDVAALADYYISFDKISETEAIKVFRSSNS